MKLQKWLRLTLYFTSLFICLLLLGIACIAPFSTSFFLAYKPITDSPSQWFERAGAVTTIFSLLAIYLLDDTLNRLVDPRKTAGLENIKIYNALEVPAGVLKTIAFLATLSGTAVWGYGTVILSVLNRVG